MTIVGWIPHKYKYELIIIRGLAFHQTTTADVVYIHIYVQDRVLLISK